MHKIGDRQIRGALLALLDEQYDRTGTIIVSELPIALGTVKLDVAVIDSGVHGFEIKSDLDNLSRLSQQMHWYAKVCDTLTVVTTAKYADAVRTSIPNWCGIHVARPGATGVTMDEIQKALDNPDRDIHALLLLLWQNETHDLAKTYGLRVPRQYAKSLTHRMLTGRIAHDDLRAQTLATLRKRTTWTANQRWRAEA